MTEPYSDVARALSRLERAFLIGVDGVTEVWLVRHGHPDSGPAGSFDPGLSARGREQAQRLAVRVATWSPAAVYSSPSRRARETGLVLSGRIQQDDRLEEAEVKVEGGRVLQVEPFDEVVDRMGAAVQDATAAHPGGRVVVVSHGLAILNYLVRVLELEPGSLHFFPRHTSVSAVHLGGGRRILASLGDVAHLEMPAR